MAARRPQPKMLNDVMDAIANLKETRGSTMRRILNQLETNYTFQRKPAKVTPQPIVKALKHGVEMGLIRRHKGKFKLGLDPKDYAIYKTFQRKLKAKECSGRKKKRSRRHKRRSSKSRRRRRHVDIFGREPNDAEIVPSSRESDSTNPEDRARRRRKRKGRKKSRKGRHRGRKGRRGKGRRRSYTSETSDDSTRDRSPKSSRQSSRSASDTNANGTQRKEEAMQEQDRQYHPNCGNPECLCNVNEDDRVDEDN